MHKSKPGKKWARSWHHGKWPCGWRSCFQTVFWRIAILNTPSPLQFLYDILWKSFLNELRHWILKCMHEFQEACSWRPCSCMTSWLAVPLFTSWPPHVKSNENFVFATYESMALKLWNLIKNHMDNCFYLFFSWKPLDFYDKGFLIIMFFKGSTKNPHIMKNVLGTVQGPIQRPQFFFRKKQMKSKSLKSVHRANGIVTLAHA